MTTPTDPTVSPSTEPATEKQQAAQAPPPAKTVGSGTAAPAKPAVAGVAKPGTTPPPKPPPPASPIAILTGTEPVRTRGTKVCYCGKPLAGKTRYMLSWPQACLICMDPDVETAFAVNRKRKAAGLTEIPIIAPDLTTFHNRILPAIRARKLDDLIRADPRFGDYTIRTVLFDSWTFYASAVLMDLNPNGGKADYAIWQSYLDRLTNTAEILGGIRAGMHLPDSAGRFYNYVASVHVREFMDDEGKKVEEIGPAIQGQFYDKFFAYYGAVLQCDLESGAPNPNYFVRTKANSKQKTLGSRLADLPEKCNGDYATLAKHWGLTVEGATEA